MTDEITYLLEEQARKLENAELLIERLKREVMALSFSVELHDRAAKKARAIWEEAHPDEAEEWLRREDLMVWLMERVENADGDGDNVINDNPLQVELDREKRKNEDLYRDFKGANDLYLAENMRAEKLRMALWEIRHIIWKNARMRWYSVGFWKLLVPIFSIAHNALQPSEKSSEITMDKKPGAEVAE